MDSMDEQIEMLRRNARRRIADRGETPTSDHWVQWHEFLDIDPHLWGRDYTDGGTHA